MRTQRPEPINGRRTADATAANPGAVDNERCIASALVGLPQPGRPSEPDDLVAVGDGSGCWMALVLAQQRQDAELKGAQPVPITGAAFGVAGRAAPIGARRDGGTR